MGVLCDVPLQHTGELLLAVALGFPWRRSVLYWPHSADENWQDCSLRSYAWGLFLISHSGSLEKGCWNEKKKHFFFSCWTDRWLIFSKPCAHTVWCYYMWKNKLVSPCSCLLIHYFHVPPAFFLFSPLPTPQISFWRMGCWQAWYRCLLPLVVYADVPIYILEKINPEKWGKRNDFWFRTHTYFPKSRWGFDRRQRYESSLWKALALSTGLLCVVLTDAGAVNC